MGAALPFLTAARHVVIVTVAEEGSGDSASAARLAATLRRHRIEVGVETVQPGTERPVEALLAAARTVRADLLVMGGYGHTRLREMVFGGFTEHALRGAELPLLMAH